jgi:hypothetical protein
MNLEEAVKTYTQVDSSELDAIMDTCGSDKGTAWHYYTRFYNSLFQPVRTQPLKVFELGLGTNNIDISSNMGAHGKPGASLYGWSKYFSDADIYGADIDKECLFDHYKFRIKTYYCDQTDPKVIHEMWSNEDLNDIQFDILIEDGLHEAFANKIFFEESIYKVKKGGVYIIEDINEKNQEYFHNLIEEWKVKYPMCTFYFFEVETAGTKPNDNWMLVAQIS